MRIRPVSKAGMKASAAVAVLVLVSIIWSMAGNPNMEWGVVGEYLFASLTLKGVLVTLYLTVASLLIGIVGGVLVAVMRLSGNPVLYNIAGLYIGLFRGTPLLVQIIFWGYMGALFKNVELGIPFTGITFFSVPTNQLISPVVAAILALGLNEVAYACEIIRGGIIGVDKGQTEAAYSVGMPPRRTMLRIVLPQAMRTVIPALGNEVITMLKMTSLVSVIAGADLLTNLQNVYSQTYQVIPLLIVASIWYCGLSAILSVPQGYLERRFGRGHESGGDR
ncbi:amino acid ABC transporter permease [Arthrobacter bambusae]|nr:amino acid ABC transporter permease [Arthrobacter bambusae]